MRYVQWSAQHCASAQNLVVLQRSETILAVPLFLTDRLLKLCGHSFLGADMACQLSSCGDSVFGEGMAWQLTFW